MMNYYIETSALLPLLLGQNEWKETAEVLNSNANLFSSRLTSIEAERAGARRQANLAPHIRQDPRPALRATLSRFQLIEMTPEICEAAGTLLPDEPLRSLDAIHLATFLKLRKRIPDLQILTFDRRIQEALPKLSPK